VVKRSTGPVLWPDGVEKTLTGFDPRVLLLLQESCFFFDMSPALDLQKVLFYSRSAVPWLVVTVNNGSHHMQSRGEVGKECIGPEVIPIPR
jgi:hypothetical protein